MLNRLENDTLGADRDHFASLEPAMSPPLQQFMHRQGFHAFTLIQERYLPAPILAVLHLLCNAKALPLSN